MGPLTPRQVMLPAVLCLTLVHLAIRLSTRTERDPMFVSPLHPGETVAASALPAAAAALPADHCLQLIVFSPDCPFCQRAADREGETLAAAGREQRLWYTDKETASLPAFVSQHLHRQPGISAELVKELEIQAVPALFVLSPQGEVRWVGSYYGDEPDQELADRCTGAHEQSPKT